MSGVPATAAYCGIGEVVCANDFLDTVTQRSPAAGICEGAIEGCECVAIDFARCSDPGRQSPNRELPKKAYQLDDETEVRARLVAMKNARHRSLPLIVLHSQLAPASAYPPRSGALDAMLAEDVGVGYILAELSRCAASIPVIGLLCGQARQSAAFLFGLSDWCITVDGSSAAAGSEEMTKRLSQKYVESRTDRIQSAKRGSVPAATVAAALATLRELVRLTSGPESPAADSAQTQCQVIELPHDRNVAHDAHSVISDVLDEGSFIEREPGNAPELITGLGRCGGRAVAIVANQTMVMGGMITAAAARKIADFVGVVDKYSIPTVFLADNGGLATLRSEDQTALLDNVACVFRTLANSRCPKMSIVLRRSYSAGFFAMGGSGFADRFVLVECAEAGIVGEHAAQKLAIPRVSAIAGADPLPPQYETVRYEDLRGRVADFASNPPACRGHQKA